MTEHIPMTPQQLSDSLRAAAQEKAWLQVETMASVEQLRLTEDDRLKVEIGIAAGMTAMMLALNERGMVCPPKEAA